MKKFLHLLFSRIFVFILAILIQITLIMLGTFYLGQFSILVYLLYLVLSFFTLLYIVSSDDNPIYKLAWVLPIATFPFLGWLIYLLFGRGKIPKKRTASLIHAHKAIEHLAPQEESVMEEIRRKDSFIYRQVSYLNNVTNLPLCKNTLTEYLSPGERFFERLCEELEKAKKFILMEYFILENGRMWDTILDILARKAKAGVEVKFLFDDFGCLTTLPSGYCKKMRRLGIETHVFNPLRPSVDTFMNFRDHRKITVIDGNVGFTGGNNLADEYINAIEKHGHWKDSSIMLKGEGVWNLTLLFFEIWHYYDSRETDYGRYRPTLNYPTDGYVITFGDSPLDNEQVGEICYMNMIQNARESVTITTPYLILDQEMRTSLCASAKSGVRVQIVTPGIADKWYVHAVTRYNYRALVEAGVEIYEYTGGFIHAKTVVADKKCAVVGSQNFDFRSFYLHFECGVYLYEASTIQDVAADHEAVIARSHRITLEECRKRSWPARVVQVILNLFAPLM